MSESKKTIYDLELHESIVVEQNGDGYPYKWQVIRVASGWLYLDQNPNRTNGGEFFVPFDNKFQKAPNEPEPWMRQYFYFLYTLLQTFKIMRLIAIWIMKNRLKKAQKAQNKLDNTIVAQAYQNMINNYKDTIMFLEANTK